MRLEGQLNEKKINIAFSPLTSDNNKYIGITVESLRRAGAKVYEFYPIFRNPALFIRTDIVILNWFERLGKSKPKRFIKFLLKIAILAVLKFSGKKVIYVLHNQISHEESDKKLSWIFIRYLCRHVDRIIILSNGSRDVLSGYLSAKQIDNKARLVPHPNYIGAYKKPQQVFSNDEEKPTLLFIGAIRPYKNIELILSAAEKFQNTEMRFVIAGRPFSQGYKAQIEKKAKELHNVELKLAFIDDDAISVLVQSADALILPYDIKNSLNSGTILLAFSYAKTVISPNIATLLDFPADLVYGYDYAVESDHEAALCDQVGRFAEDFRKDRMLVLNKGTALKALVEKNNSAEVIDSCYIRLLDEFKK